MKQNYKAFAPDISSGGTTIKDVGKQRFSRKSSNSSKLWRLLICLMAVVMPVGAWGQSEGLSPQQPLKDNIGYKKFTAESETLNIYLDGVTSTNEDNPSRIQIDGNGHDVILHVAGHNYLHAYSDRVGVGRNNEIAAIMVSSNTTSFTIQYWNNNSPTNKVSVLELQGEGTNVPTDNFRTGLYFNQEDNYLTINGPVAVLAHSQNGWAEGQDAPAAEIDKINVKLSNGAHFAYDRNYMDGHHPKSWEIENFASAGDEAYEQIIQYIEKEQKGVTATTVKVNNLHNELAKQTLNSKQYLYGTISSETFVVPDNADKFKLLFNNTVKYYYGEVAAEGSLNYPFPIRMEDNPGKILTEVNVGSAISGDEYLGLLEGKEQNTITLNVGKYPHSGIITASQTNSITIMGTPQYRTLNADATTGLTLNGTNNTITLNGINSESGSINISGDVRLKGECNIQDGITKYQDTDVYYYIINYKNTDLAEATEDIIIMNKKLNTKIDYPFTVDKAADVIYAWLPESPGLTFEVKAGTAVATIKDEITTDHNQTIFVAEPVICVDNDNNTGNDVKYPSLSKAFENVTSGGTIYFIGDYNAVNGDAAMPTQIKANESFTLNLNGYRLNIDGQYDADNNLPLISSGVGKLILENSNVAGTTFGQNGGEIAGNYRIGGLVYANDFTNLGNAHIEGINVEPKIVNPTITNTNSMPASISYKIDKVDVKAAKHSTENKYCLWVPTQNKVIAPVKDEAGTIFAQIKENGSGSYELAPLFDLNSYNIEVATSGVTYGLDDNKYVATGFGTETTSAEIVTVAENNYATENTLTVNGGTHVILKNIYTGLQTGDGKVGDKAIATKLEVTGTGNADIKTSGINSIGTITIAQDATLVFNQLEETPATANALRFATINDQTAQGTLKVESGTLLAYLNDTEADQINVATATYTGGSVRAKFEKNTNRFKKEDNTTALYRTSFKVNEYYTPYEYNILDNTGNPTLTGKTTSDKNGEIHLWLPHKDLGGTAKFRSSNLAVAEEEIVYSAVAEKDNNIAPASIGLYPGSTIDVDHKIGSFNSLADAFNAMTTNQEYTVVLYTAHTESNTTCTPVGPQVTIDLNGMTLNCHNVTFETTAENFMLITNNAASTNPDDEKHATISGDITVSQNVYISKNVHMEGIHVDMINPNYQESVSGDEPEFFKGVRRLLVKGLEENVNYIYEYAEQQIGFTVKQKADDKIGLACLWLVESMYPQEFVVYAKEGGNVENGLTVPGNELAIVAHSNNYTQLVKGGIVATVTANQDVNSFRTLSAAIDFANKNNAQDIVITLLENIQSQATFDIVKDYAIDLNGHDLTFTQGGFNVTNSNLIIKDESKDKGFLAGVIKLINKENVSVDPAVTIGGVVVDASQATPVNIYRLMVDGGANASLNTWVETPERDTDKQYGTTYEYTIPAGLANHSTKVKGYKVVTVDANTNFDAVNNCNVIVPENITWSATGTGYIHRLTIKAGGMVNAGDGTKITATDGIRYVRTFKEDKWSLIALPFTATDITTVDKTSKKVVSISPAADPGTSGHFWLHTIKNDGSTTDVTDSEMTANKVYVMKVPNSLLNQEITFVSGPNQMLRRDKVLAPNPISGFVAYANGTLNEVSMNDKKYYYTLDEVDGEQMFVRKKGASSKIAPFSGYLLADAATTKAVARFSLRSTPTANEEIEIAEDELQIRTEAGRIILTTETPVQVVICDLKGTVKFSGEIPAGDSSYEVGAGIYIINNQKVIVK